MGIVPIPVCAPRDTANEPTTENCSAMSMLVVLSSPNPPYSSVGMSTMRRPSSPALRRSSGTSPDFFDSIWAIFGRISSTENLRAARAISRCSSLKSSGAMIFRAPPPSQRKLAPEGVGSDMPFGVPPSASTCVFAKGSARDCAPRFEATLRSLERAHTATHEGPLLARPPGCLKVGPMKAWLGRRAPDPMEAPRGGTRRPSDRAACGEPVRPAE